MNVFDRDLFRDMFLWFFKFWSREVPELRGQSGVFGVLIVSLNKENS